MTKISNIHVDENLLINYIAGEATPVEAIAVDEWLKNPANKIEYDSLVNTWNFVAAKNYKQPDVNESWNQLQNVLTKTQVKGNISYKRLWYAAAAAIILIIAIVIIYATHPDSKNLNTKYVQLKASAYPLVQTLPDKSVVTVGRNSSIKYPFHFNKKNREVFLNGEAYFNVMPDKSNPFIIYEDELNIKVVGTKFNVSNEVENRFIKVQVQSGTVLMYTAKDKILVSKGKTGVYDKPGKKFMLYDSLDENSLSYATKNFNFTNLNLKTIAGYLEQAFSVKINFKNPELEQCRLSARFQNKSLDYIMHVISITLNITYTINNDIIIVDGKACN